MATTTSGTLLVGVFAAISVFDLPVLGFNGPSKVQTVDVGSPVLSTSTTLSGTVHPVPEGAAGTQTTLAATVSPGSSAGTATQQPAPSPSPGAVVQAPSTNQSAPSSSSSQSTPRGTVQASPPATTAPPAAVTTTAAPRTTTTTAAPRASCAFTGIDTVGKYTTGGIEVEGGSNLATRVTVKTSGTCTGTMTMRFASPAYTLTLSGSGSTWTGTIPKGALRGLTADQSLSATLSVGGASNATVTLKTVVQNGSGSGSGS